MLRMRYLTVADKQISVVGLGAWQFGSRGWGWNTEFGASDAHAIITRALELGITLFDTAEIYSGGHSERILGAAIAANLGVERRSDAYVATKIWPLHPFRRQVVPALCRSLARLGMNKADLYQLHWPNPLVPLAWTFAGMRDARAAGLVDQIGVSNFGRARWQRADAALGSPVISNQVPYNLVERKAEREVIPFAQANDRLILAYSPLAQGLLSGRYSVDNIPGGFRRTNALFLPENIRRIQPVLDVLTEVAEAHRVTPAQIALAWTIRAPRVAAIPGAKSVWQLEQNAEAADIELTPGQVIALDEASDAFRPLTRVRGASQLLKRLVSR
jgi:aryl-alcohol dehydrogenase-like predicted oxidoreductase